MSAVINEKQGYTRATWGAFFRVPFSAYIRFYSEQGEAMQSAAPCKEAQRGSG